MISIETRIKDTFLVMVSAGTLFLNKLTRRDLPNRLMVNAVIRAKVALQRAGELGAK
jgi:hypothetical protein